MEKATPHDKKIAVIARFPKSESESKAEFNEAMYAAIQKIMENKNKGEVQMSNTDNNAIKLFNFNDNQVRILMKGHEPWWVAKDICDILEISNSRDAVERLDTDEKGVGKIYTLGGIQDMTIINESGLYALIMRSNKPEAKAFSKWVRSEVLPTIRRTGEYAVPEVQRKKATERDEVTKKRVEAMLNNSNYRSFKAVLAAVDMMKSASEESKQVLVAKASEKFLGTSLNELLPEITEKWYSAKEIGELFGVSAQRVGIMSNEYSIKAPEGEKNEYGHWIRSKSEYSAKEVQTWVYNENGKKWFEQHLGKVA